MSSRINSREETEDLQSWLDGDHVLDETQDSAGGTPEVAVDPCWRSNMLIQVLLRGGQASPTHTFVYLDRYERICMFGSIRKNTCTRSTVMTRVRC